MAARHLHTVAVRRMSFATSAAVARLLTRFFMLPNRGIGSTASSASTVFLRPPPGERGLPSAETAAGVDCDVFDFANNLRRASPSGGLLSERRGRGSEASASSSSSSITAGWWPSRRFRREAFGDVFGELSRDDALDDGLDCMRVCASFELSAR